MRGFNYRKSVQALNFLAIKNGGEMNKMKAIKLVWLSDRLHLRKYARTITGDIYFALPNGPVCSTTRDLLEQYDSLSEIEIQYSDEFIQPKGKYFFKSIKDCYLKVFSKTDIEVLDLVWSKYGHLNEYELVELSHLYPEWLKYKSALEKRVITRANMDLLDFFSSYDDGTGLFAQDDESISDSIELFKEHLIHSSI